MQRKQKKVMSMNYAEIKAYITISAKVYIQWSISNEASLKYKGERSTSIIVDA